MLTFFRNVLGEVYEDSINQNSEQHAINITAPQSRPSGVAWICVSILFLSLSPVASGPKHLYAQWPGIWTLYAATGQNQPTKLS